MWVVRMGNSCYVVVAIGLVTSRMLIMSIIVVSLLFKQIKTDLLNCLQSITLLQMKYCFVLKMNPIAFSSATIKRCYWVQKLYSQDLRITNLYIATCKLESKEKAIGFIFSTKQYFICNSVIDWRQFNKFVFIFSNNSETTIINIINILEVTSQHPPQHSTNYPFAPPDFKF